MPITSLNQNTQEYTDSYLRVKYTSARHRPKDCVCRDKIHRSKYLNHSLKAKATVLLLVTQMNGRTKMTVSGSHLRNLYGFPRQLNLYYIFPINKSISHQAIVSFAPSTASKYKGILPSYLRQFLSVHTLWVRGQRSKEGHLKKQRYPRKDI